MESSKEKCGMDEHRSVREDNESMKSTTEWKSANLRPVCDAVQAISFCEARREARQTCREQLALVFAVLVDAYR